MSEVSDDRLKELIDVIPDNAVWGMMKGGTSHRVVVHDLLVELQTSRQTIKRLVEDLKSVRKFAGHFPSCAFMMSFGKAKCDCGYDAQAKNIMAELKGEE
jgi:hypothetical protein